LRRKASNSQRSTPGHKTTLHKSQRILAIGYDAKVDATMGLMPQHGPGDGLGPMNDITPATMTRRQKAAVIVRLLLAHGVSPGVDKLSPAHQSVLARAMSGLGQIDRATLADIVGEFTGALDNLALIMPRGMHDALEILDPHISAMARDGLKADAAIGDGTDPWPRLAAMDVAQLRPILDEESAEICAILLSKLNVAKAAALLSDLPPDRAEVIAHAVSLTDTILPETALRIGEHLHAQIVAQAQGGVRHRPGRARRRDAERGGHRLPRCRARRARRPRRRLRPRACAARSSRSSISPSASTPPTFPASPGAVDGDTLSPRWPPVFRPRPSRWSSSSRTCPSAWPNRCATRRRR
jgi:hypothetical protein